MRSTRYYTSEVPPLVEIYADRISITSYGGLLSGLSLEECLSGRSMPRNRELMRVFRDMELVEHLGSGMRRILNAYDSSIVHISEHFFELRFPMDARALQMASEAAAESGTESLSKKILHLLRDAALSKSELSSQLGLKFGHWRADPHSPAARRLGAGVIPRLARDLHNELPEEKGFSERNIKRMLAFYREYPHLQFVPQAVAQMEPDPKVLQAEALFPVDLVQSIPWRHHTELMAKVKDLAARLWSSSLPACRAVCI